MTKQQHPQRFRWLVPMALVFIGIAFGSHYVKFPLTLAVMVLERLPLGLRLTRLLRMPILGFYWITYPIDLLFTALTGYLALSIIGLAVALGALALARPARPGRAALLLGLVAILALPFVRRYRPAVEADPNRVHISVPTQPDLLNGVVKAVQAGTEVRQCDYKLLGWSAQDALYGEETCGANHRFWVYWPMSDRRLQTVSSVPTDLLRQEISREELRAAGVRSTIPLDDALRIIVREPGLASQEGWWSAFVARHLYGPEDVVIIMH